MLLQVEGARVQLADDGESSIREPKGHGISHRIARCRSRLHISNGRGHPNLHDMAL